jgi:hypothetical protein
VRDHGGAKAVPVILDKDSDAVITPRLDTDACRLRHLGDAGQSTRHMALMGRVRLPPTGSVAVSAGTR